ncbi:MAG: Leukotoxin export protein LtxD [Bacteroidota bacterium]|nr:MAG: Leukotoxin export protein LtxD [Bacteroidota bacterium]
MSEETRKIDEIDEYSEQLREVLTKIPNWFFRWGTVLTLLSVVVIFFFSWFIKYPDVVISEITITTQTQPIDIICKSDGVLKEIYLSENQEIEENDIIGFIENEANYEDVLTLIDFLRSDSSVTIQKRKFPKNLRLGIIQESYNEFLNVYSSYWLNKTNQPTEREIVILERQNGNNKILLNQLKKKKELFKKELELSDRDFIRDSMLHSKQFISDRDVEIKQIEIMKKKRGFQDVLNQISNTQITIAKIEQEILSLSNRSIVLSNNNEQNVLLKLEQLKGNIEGWKRNYLLQSPISGRISFNRFIEKNTFVKADDNLFTIIPKNPGKIEGQLVMPVVRSGKVKKGQKVNIKLNNFLYQEYGMLIGRVEEISLTPLNENYIVKVVLLNDLKTTYGKELPFNQKMNGNAEIVTEDLRLIERIFYQFRKLLKE